MATTRHAHTVWDGTLLEGSGQVTLDSSELGTFPVSWASRSESANAKTSPEELIAAAHSTCFSMALASALTKAGTPPTHLTTSAEVDFQPGQGITAIRLSVHGEVPGLDADAFAAAAQGAKENCPVSKALAAVPITLSVQ
jgi:osmotically inducible protein OsmC